MKVCIKSFFLSVLMSLVTLVSCVQEANDGSQRLDGTVADLSGQVASVSSSLEQLNALQNVVEQDLSELSADLEAHIGYLKSGVSRMDGTMATLQLQKEVAMVVAELQAAGFESSMTQFVKSVKSWLGKSFETYFDVLVYGCASQALVEGAALQLSEQQGYIDAVLSDVEAGLRDGVPAEELASVLETLAKNLASATELTSKVDEIVLDLETECAMAVEALFDEPSSYDATALKKAATQARIQLKSSEVTISDLVARIETIETAVAEIKANISGLRANVDELLGMIQSVSFMSKYSEDYAIAYYDMSTTEKVTDQDLPYNGKAVRTATGTMELDFIVRPAAASIALNAKPELMSIMGYYANRISTKAPNPSDYINLKITKVVATDENRGLVTVTVTPDFKEAFYYKEVGAKCALSIKSGKSDITSKFIEILPKDNSRTVYVTGITPSRYTVTLDKGQTLDLDATVAPDDASTKNFHWTSNNTDVVTFSGNTLNAVGVGETTVRVTTAGVDEWGVQLYAEIPVKVNEAFRIEGPRYVEEGLETEYFLTYPSDAQIETVVWTSSDSSKVIPTKKQEGRDAIVEGISHTYNTNTKNYNPVTISCTINGVSTVSKEIFVAAVQPKALVTENFPDGVSVRSMYVDQSFSVKSTISPENVPSGAYRVMYLTSGIPNHQFADGIINPNYQTVTLNPTTINIDIWVDNVDGGNYLVGGNLLKRIAVKVLPYLVKTIKLEDLKLEPQQSAPITATLTSEVTGKNPTITALTWQSSNENIATVDQNGKVTALSEGEVTITATAKDGSNVSGSCTVTITKPWKEFNVGDYVVRKNVSKDIEFYSNLTTAQSNGYVVGIVITKTNPRATDTALPESCTHGIALALGEGNGKWWSNSYYADNTYRPTVASWASQNGVAFVEGTDKYSGYTNTLALKAYMAANSDLSSGIVDALNTYNNNTGPGRPNGTSEYYIPSAPAMKDIGNLSGSNWTFSNKVSGMGGTAFSNAQYWTVSETGSTSVTSVNPLTGNTTSSQKTSDYKVRYVFAF